MLITVVYSSSLMLQTAQPVVTIGDMNIPTWLRGVMEVRGYRGVRETARELNKELERRGVPDRLDYSQIARWLKGDTSPSVPSCRLLHSATGYPLRDLVLMAAFRDGAGDVRT